MQFFAGSSIPLFSDCLPEMINLNDFCRCNDYKTRRTDTRNARRENVPMSVVDWDWAEHSRPSVDFSIGASYYTLEIIYLYTGTGDGIMTGLAIKTEGSIKKKKNFTVSLFIVYVRSGIIK